MLEEDIALANIALDLIGQARSLYAHAGGGRGRGPRRGRARLSARRRRVPQRAPRRAAERRFRRHHRAAVPLRGPSWRRSGARSRSSRDATLAAIAAKAEKEAAYHLRHASEWLIRLGDGTDESHARAQAALDELWPYTGELFEVDAIERGLVAARHRRRSAGAAPGVGRDASTGCSPRRRWRARPSDWMQTGGRAGRHTEHLGFICSPICSSCSAPIRERSGERCAGPSPARLGERPLPASRERSFARAPGPPPLRSSIPKCRSSPSPISACCAMSRSPMTARSRSSITPTYSGCPAMTVIALEVELALARAGIADARVKTVLSPAWTTDWMTAGRPPQAQGLRHRAAGPEGVAARARSASRRSPARTAGRRIPRSSPSSARPHARRCGAARAAASRSTISSASEFGDRRTSTRSRSRRSAAETAGRGVDRLRGAGRARRGLSLHARAST